MGFEQDIDRVCNELTLSVENLRKFFKATVKSNISVGLMKGQNIFNHNQREELLEKTIRESISKLEKTKKHFKSKTVKEVREKLIKAIG